MVDASRRAPEPVANADRCLVCGSAIGRRVKGVISPFVAERIWKRPPIDVALCSCPECGFHFFSRRLSDEEEGRLYGSYRSKSYQEERFRFEPWYTAQLNESISSPAQFIKRRRALRRLFEVILAGREILNILDYGGGGGELLTELLPRTTTYVYDISGSAALDGAIALRTLASCREYRFDLVVCSNVLEHVSAPRSFLDEIGDIAGPGTLVYFEVPRESPFGALTLAKRLLQQAILSMKRPRVALELFRHNFLVQMHEHVNFFGRRSLARLVSVQGWEIVDSGTYAVEVYQFGAFKVPATSLVWCLARVPFGKSRGRSLEPTRNA